MPIRDLRVTNIGPFDDLAFEFDEHVNVFVGPNSSGKSTTLMTLANIATYPFTLPERLRKNSPATFLPSTLLGVMVTPGADWRLPVDHAALTHQPRWVTMLTALGYSAFVPALRQSTGFRSSGSSIGLTGENTAAPRGLGLVERYYPRCFLIRAEAVLSAWSSSQTVPCAAMIRPCAAVDADSLYRLRDSGRFPR